MSDSWRCCNAATADELQTQLCHLHILHQQIHYVCQVACVCLVSPYPSYVLPSFISLCSHKEPSFHFMEYRQWHILVKWFVNKLSKSFKQLIACESCKKTELYNPVNNDSLAKPQIWLHTTWEINKIELTYGVCR